MGMIEYNDPDFTRKFVDKYMNGTQEMKKEAAYSATSIVRLSLQEGGIVRSVILPQIPITDDMLDRDQNADVLKYFMEIEPTSEATWVPLNGTTSSSFVKGRFSPVYFGKIQSKEHKSNIYTLKTSRTDLRKIIDELDAKYLQKEEDRAFVDEINVICAANPAEQVKNFSGGLTKKNWTAARKSFFADKPIAFALMNNRTAMSFNNWDLDSDFGLDTSFANMASTGTVSKVHGIQIVGTNKTDIVADNEVFFFAPSDFIGKMFVLQDAITYIEQRKDWLVFSTHEVIGIGIANRKCVVKCIFNP